MPVLTLSDVGNWLAVITAGVGLVVGTVLGAIANFADRWYGRKQRSGDLAAVGIRHGNWSLGSMVIPMTQVGAGEWTTSQDAKEFPIAVTNGSGEKITSVEFGLRWLWADGPERLAGFVGVLLPGEKEEGVAYEPVDVETIEPQDFDDDWLERVEFFIRFTDQRGGRHENRLRSRPTPSWESHSING